jgi:hypothetical protein
MIADWVLMIVYCTCLLMMAMGEERIMVGRTRTIQEI